MWFTMATIENHISYSTFLYSLFNYLYGDLLCTSALFRCRACTCGQEEEDELWCSRPSGADRRRLNADRRLSIKSLAALVTSHPIATAVRPSWACLALCTACCICLPVFVCLYVSISVCASVSELASVSLSFSVFVAVAVSRYLSVRLLLVPFLFQFLSNYLVVCLSLSVRRPPLSSSVFVPTSICLFQSLSHCFSCSVRVTEQEKQCVCPNRLFPEARSCWILHGLCIWTVFGADWISM